MEPNLTESLEDILPPKERWTKDELEKFHRYQLIDILRSHGFSISINKRNDSEREKKKLIDTILKYGFERNDDYKNIRKDKSEPIDKYLIDGEIYNKFMDTVKFNSHFTNDNNYAINQYNKYMQKLIKEKNKDIIDNYKLERIKRKLNNLIKDELGSAKHYRKIGKKVLTEIKSYPNPKYYDIILIKDQIDIIVKKLRKEIMIYSIQQLLKEYTGIKYDFNPGDIIGLRTSPTDEVLTTELRTEKLNENNKLPYYIINVHNNLTAAYPFKIDENMKKKYEEIGEYELPDDLSNIDIIKDIELIYNFPFASHIERKIKLL